MAPQTVLVTGASGFLGGTISRAVKAHCDRLVVCAHRDDLAAKIYSDRRACYRLPDPRLIDLIAQERPSWLIHCAGSASVRASIADPKADRRANVGVTEFLFATLARNSPQTRVINLSSAAVYGQPKALPISLETVPAPVSPYGIHKRECEQIAERYGSQYGIATANLRIFSSYGPGLRKQVLWDIYKKSLAGHTISLFGDGTETRDFIFSRDIASVVVRIIREEDFAAGGVTRYLNLASGRSVQIGDLASQFLETMGIRAKLRFTGESAAGDPKHWSVDAAPLAEYGLETPTPLDEGLSIYTRWIRSLKGNADADRTLAAAG
jgi:UDP-glucose 4-epimerase